MHLKIPAWKRDKWVWCRLMSSILRLVPDDITVLACFASCFIFHDSDPFLSLVPDSHGERISRLWPYLICVIIDLFHPRCHGNPWDRSQFSVEAGGLFSNMNDFPFHGCHHLQFLIRLLIGENEPMPSLICKLGNPAFQLTDIHCAVISYGPNESPILLLHRSDTFFIVCINCPIEFLSFSSYIQHFADWKGVEGIPWGKVMNCFIHN